MNKIEGLEEAFKEAKVVSLTTFDEKGNENTRAMTNFNDDPYSVMWFPTEKGTQKVKDIEGNPRVLLTIPCDECGFFYEIEGEAEFAEPEVVKEKWKWWYLYWRPVQRRRFWFPQTMDDPKRVIININPKAVKIINAAT
jgi:general stress protein 26